MELEHRNGYAPLNGCEAGDRTPALNVSTSANVDPVAGEQAGAGQDTAAHRPAESNGRPLQQVGEARRRQGLSVRCMAQRLGRSIGEIRAQEEEHADMLLSELYRWQAVLEVPLEELLADPQDALSPRVELRARMLRVMKTARALAAQRGANRNVGWRGC